MKSHSTNNSLWSWASLTDSQKRVWLEDAYNRRFASDYKASPRINQVVKLPGKLIKSELDFYCAFGESVNGSKGYFGQGFMGFDDCLFGGFGLDKNYTIEWMDSDVSLSYLDAEALKLWVDEVSHLASDDLNREIRKYWADNVSNLFEVFVSVIRSVPERSHHKISVDLILS